MPGSSRREKGSNPLNGGHVRVIQKNRNDKRSGFAISYSAVATIIAIVAIAISLGTIVMSREEALRRAREDLVATKIRVTGVALKEIRADNRKILTRLDKIEIILLSLTNKDKK